MLDDYRKDLKRRTGDFEAAAKGRILSLLDGKKSAVVQALKQVTILSTKDIENLPLESLLDIQPAEEEVSERLGQIAEFLSDKQKDIDNKFTEKNAN